MKLDFKNNLTLRTKMALTKKVLKAKFDCTYFCTGNPNKIHYLQVCHNNLHHHNHIHHYCLCHHKSHHLSISIFLHDLDFQDDSPIFKVALAWGTAFLEILLSLAHRGICPQDHFKWCNFTSKIDLNYFRAPGVKQGVKWSKKLQGIWIFGFQPLFFSQNWIIFKNV